MVRRRARVVEHRVRGNRPRRPRGRGRNRRARLRYRGTGAGRSTADRVFDLFYRSGSTARSVSGSGIGLYVCRRLVEAMSGSIAARRRPEGGSEFAVSLLLYADDVDLPDGVASTAPPEPEEAALRP